MTALAAVAIAVLFVTQLALTAMVFDLYRRLATLRADLKVVDRAQRAAGSIARRADAKSKGDA